MKRLGLLILLRCCGIAMAAKAHFRQFYPQIRPYMEHYLSNNCSSEYDTYLHNPNFTSFNTLDCKECAAAPVTGCLLNTFHETDKVNMASAAVLLGILPATLSLAGSNTAETGLLSLRRPLLAFLIGAGAPAVSPTRMFNYGEELVQLRPKSIRAPRLGRTSSIVMIVAEYVFALTAVANLCLASYQLCLRTICSFAQDTSYLPALWAFLAAAVHVFGALAVTLHVRITETHSNKRRSIRQRIKDEFQLSYDQKDATLTLLEESPYCIFVSWLTSSGTVVHIIFGTLVFSSILFITTLDAVTVVFQFLGSTIVCRAGLMFELNGIRKRVRIGEGEGRETGVIPLMERCDQKPTW